VQVVPYNEVDLGPLFGLWRGLDLVPVYGDDDQIWYYYDPNTGRKDAQRQHHHRQHQHTHRLFLYKSLHSHAVYIPNLLLYIGYGLCRKEYSCQVGVLP
jgi:hypothetical protein